MHGENIICFAKDWTEDPTSNNYVMRMLAHDNRVLWLNSIATRAPSLSSGSDLRKIVRKVRTFVDGPREVESGLSVFTPLVLPLPHSAVAQRVNTGIMRATTALLRRRLGMNGSGFQLWTFLPTAAKFVGKLGESFVVYYCTDEWSQFSSVDGKRVAEMEADLCRRADVVFATARVLVERKKVYNPNTFLASHGVDHDHFSKVLAPDLRVAPDLAKIPGPRIGFFGLVQDWIDLDLLGTMAEKRPDWSIVMIGSVKVDRSRLDRFKNIHWLGRKEYASLPSYCKGFDVAIIPFVKSELTRNVNPIKLREYLSAGLPVVSTNIPECTYYPDWCAVADDADEFIAACDRALANDSPDQRQARSAAMALETWEKKVAALGEHILRVKAQKS